jgi:hypothetical protein
MGQRVGRPASRKCLSVQAEESVRRPEKGLKNGEKKSAEKSVRPTNKKWKQITSRKLWWFMLHYFIHFIMPIMWFFWQGSGGMVFL